MNQVKYIVVLMAVIGSLVIVKGENEAAVIDNVDRVKITQVNDAPLAETAVQTVTIVEDDSADLVELVTSDDDKDQGGEQTDTNELIPVSSSEQQQVDETDVKSAEVDDLVKQIEEDNAEIEPPIEIIAEPETPQLVKKAASVLERPIDSSLTQGDDADNAPIGDINSYEEPKQSDANVQESNKPEMDYDDSESNSEIDNKNSDNKVESDVKVDETTTTITAKITTTQSEENLNKKEEPAPIEDNESKVETVPTEEVEQHVPDTNNTDADLERDQNSNLSSVDIDKNLKNNETLIEDPTDENNKIISEQPQPPPEKLNTDPDSHHHITDSMIKQQVNSKHDDDEKTNNKNESRTRPAGVNVFFIIIPVVCGAAVLLIVAAMILYRRTSLFRSSEDRSLDVTPSTSKRPIYKQVPGQEIEPANPEAQKLTA